MRDVPSSQDKTKHAISTHRLDRHPSTVERKGEQDVLALMAFELCSKDGLRQREGMSNVQVSIRVRIRKRHQERLLGSVGVCLECSFLLPHDLHRNFVLSQRVTLEGSFGSRRSFFLFRCHVLSFFLHLSLVL